MSRYYLYTRDTWVWINRYPGNKHWLLNGTWRRLPGPSHWNSDALVECDMDHPIPDTFVILKGVPIAIT